MTPAELAIALRGEAGARLATWEWRDPAWALVSLLGWRKLAHGIRPEDRSGILEAEARAVAEGWAVVQRPYLFEEFSGLGRWPVAPGEVEPDTRP